MTDLIFLDTETTGLRPESHEVWEIAYAINDGNIITHQLAHSLATADHIALELNGYYDRCEAYLYRPQSIQPTDVRLRELFKDNTLVAANPTFDRMMLRKRWGGIEPWHYRSIDIETVAMTVFGWDRPKGMKDISLKLGAIGYEIPAPDHTAAGDVAALRASYYALRDVMNQSTDYHRRTPFSFDPSVPFTVVKP